MKFYMLNLLFILTSFYASFIKVPVKKRTENKTIYLAMEIWLRWIIALWRQDSAAYCLNKNYTVERGQNLQLIGMY